MKRIDEIMNKHLDEETDAEATPSNRKAGEPKKFAVEYIVRSSGKTKTIYVHAPSAAEAREKSKVLLQNFKKNNPEASKMNCSFNSVEEV